MNDPITIQSIDPRCPPREIGTLVKRVYDLACLSGEPGGGQETNETGSFREGSRAARQDRDKVRERRRAEGCGGIVE